MDLNYLFYRQQIERSRAEAANTEEARKAHEELAIEYERRIGRSANTDAVIDSEVNATIAVAITAREVGQRQR